MELLERDILLDELRAMVASARAGRGRLVVLEGEAGVGKTSAMRALAAPAVAGTRVLWGACDALATPRPLGPLADMAVRGAEATAGSLAERAPIHDVFDAFLKDLRTPTLAVIEDIHWADEATLDLLRFVGRRVTDTPSLVLVSMRAEEVDPTHPLRSVLGDLATSGVERRRIEPLTEEAVRRLAAGHELDPRELYRVTGGNPFYVTEVLAAPAASVPPTVRDAVVARARRLSPAARELLELASVEPGGVERSVLRALDVADRSVDEAVRSSALVDDGRVLRFRHEIARRAIGADLTPERARELHRRFLATLQHAGADPARLAHHAAGADDPDATLHWSRLAGDAALRANAHRQALEHYSRAAALIDRLAPSHAAELLGRYAEALTAVDQPARAVDAWQKAVALLDGEADEVGRWHARAQLARALWTAGRSTEAYRLIDETVAQLTSRTASDDGRVADAYALAAYLAMLARRSADAVDWARRAIAAAESSSTRTSLPLAYNALGCARLIGFDDVDGMEDLELSARIAAEVGDRRSVVGAYSNLGSASGEVRRYEHAAPALERAVAYAVAHDFDYAGRYARAWLARVRFEQGRWTDALEIASGTLGDRASSPISLMVALGVIGRVRARRGDTDARTPLDEAWTVAQRTDDLQRTWPAIAGLAEVAWIERWSGADRDDVIHRLHAVLGLARRLQVRWAIGELAFWLDRLGAGPVDASGAAEPYAATLGGRHRKAAERWEAIGCPYEAAWALADVDDEPSLRGALDRLMRLGAGPLAMKVRRRLRELGARDVPTGPRASTSASPVGLTRRETEVLDLVRNGLTDREIAERLVLSPRTVGHHVSAILAKLGVHRRAEAIAIAHELAAPDRSAEDG